MAMIVMSKDKRKAQTLQIFHEIEQSGKEVIVTDNNCPVQHIQPIVKKRSVAEVFARHKGKAIFYEDRDIPTLAEWSKA